MCPVKETGPHMPRNDFAMGASPQKVKFHLPSRFDAVRYLTPRDLKKSVQPIEESSPQLAVEPKQEQLESALARSCDLSLFLPALSCCSRHFFGWRIVLS